MMWIFLPSFNPQSIVWEHNYRWRNVMHVAGDEPSGNTKSCWRFFTPNVKQRSAHNSNPMTSVCQTAQKQSPSTTRERRNTSTEIYVDVIDELVCSHENFIRMQCKGCFQKSCAREKMLLKSVRWSSPLSRMWVNGNFDLTVVVLVFRILQSRTHSSQAYLQEEPLLAVISHLLLLLNTLPFIFITLNIKIFSISFSLWLFHGIVVLLASDSDLILGC